jgi:hypothetical protein
LPKARELGNRPLTGDPISYFELPDLDNIVSSINYAISPISLIHNSGFDTNSLFNSTHPASKARDNNIELGRDKDVGV